MYDGAVVLYKRNNTRFWQARFKTGNYWKRITTKCMDLNEAKDVALEEYMDHLFKQKHSIPSVSKRFADIARLSIEEMRRQMETGEGLKIYSAYIAVTQNYLIPFFGSTASFSSSSGEVELFALSLRSSILSPVSKYKVLK